MSISVDQISPTGDVHIGDTTKGKGHYNIAYADAGYAHAGFGGPFLEPTAIFFLGKKIYRMWNDATITIYYYVTVDHTIALLIQI